MFRTLFLFDFSSWVPQVMGPSSGHNKTSSSGHSQDLVLIQLAATSLRQPLLGVSFHSRCFFGRETESLGAGADKTSCFLIFDPYKSNDPVKPRSFACLNDVFVLPTPVKMRLLTCSGWSCVVET